MLADTCLMNQLNRQEAAALSTEAFALSSTLLEDK
jgi:hypothetical protein